MPERPIIIRSGSLILESEEPLVFACSEHQSGGKTIYQCELRNPGVVDEINVFDADTEFWNRRKFKPKNGRFGIKLERRNERSKPRPDDTKVGVLLGIIAVTGFAAWLLKRRS